MNPSPTTASDINLVSHFLAHPDIASLPTASQTDCLVLCPSAILHCVDTVLSALSTRPTLAKTLVLCGGIGHSTPYLYDAVARHPRYGSVFPDIHGLPEARVLHTILERFYDVSSIVAGGCRILIEDRSTNCGANAIETRKLLEAQGVPTPESFIIVQDPTMSLRTLASFRKTYADAVTSPVFRACPSFVPEVRVSSTHGVLEYVAVGGVDLDGLWSLGRFCDLLLGEIPRLRDDAEGYGPRGKGFIEHVEIPDEVEKAWESLRGPVAGGRTTLAI